MPIYFLLNFLYSNCLKTYILPLAWIGQKEKMCNHVNFMLTGSLGTSVFDTDVYLVGASGGVYALLAAHLANVLLVSPPPRGITAPMAGAARRGERLWRVPRQFSHPGSGIQRYDRSEPLLFCSNVLLSAPLVSPRCGLAALYAAIRQQLTPSDASFGRL